MTRPRAPVRSGWREERGAMAIMIAICMLMLCGFAMIVVDVGAIYEERRDLQNGADAAALAVAIDCAQGINCSSGAAQPIAEQYASANANDNAATVAAADITFLGDNEVEVTARTDDAGPNIDGDTSTVDHWFARLFGHGGTAVWATARARWAPPLGAQALPITFSICEWAAMTGGGSTFPTAVHTIYFHNAQQANDGGGGPNGDPDDCIYGPGQDADGDGDNGYGGFGFLNPTGDCSATLTISGSLVVVQGEPGASHPGQLGCYGVDQFLNTTILVPIYEDILDGSSCGAPAGQTCYAISGFGALHVIGMRFGGQWTGGDYSGCDPNQDCIRGYFEQYVTLADGVDAYPGGTGTNFGAVVVELSG